MANSPVQLPLQVVLGLVNKITGPWQRINAEIRQKTATLRQIGNQWTSAVTNPLMQFGRFAVSVGSDWEDATARIELFTHSTSERAQASAKAIRTYADSVGVSISDLVEIIGPAAEKFQEIGKLEESMRVTSNLSRVLGKEPAEAFRLVSDIADRFPAKLTEIQSALAKVGGGNAADFVEQLKILGADARFRKLPINDLFAAVFARQDERGGFKQAATFLKRHGISQALIDKGNEELQRRTPVGESLEILNRGTSTGLTKLKNQLEELGIAFEKSGIVEGLKTVLRIITPIVTWFRELPAPVQKFAVVLATGLALFGPLLAGVAALSVLFNPVSLIVAAVAAGIALIAVNWDAITASMREFATWANSHLDWLIPDSWTNLNMSAPMKELSPKTVGMSNKSQADVTVRFKNAPPGTSVDAKGDARITTDLGVSLMPQVGGAH